MIRSAEVFSSTEGNTCRADMVRVCRAPRCLRNPGTHVHPCTGTREGFNSPRQSCRGRGRKETIRIDDERIEAIGFSHSTCEVGEQRNICSGGADGGKDWNQGESAKPKHAPDTGSGTHVTSGGADTASSHEETEGEAHCSSAPHHDGRARRGLLLVEEGRCGRRGRDDVA